MVQVYIHLNSVGVLSLVIVISLISTSVALPLVQSVRRGAVENDLGGLDSFEPPSQSTIELYSNINFTGHKTMLLLNTTSCVNLIGEFNDSVSSVDAKGGCVILCEETFCRGKCQRVDFYSSNLNRIGLNDVVSSVKACDSNS